MTPFARALRQEIVALALHSPDTTQMDPMQQHTADYREGSSSQRMKAIRLSFLRATPCLAIILLGTTATAQPAPTSPPAVGVIKVERQPMTDSYEFNGRIQAINSVNMVARVTGFLERQLFTEGT